MKDKKWKIIWLEYANCPFPNCLLYAGRYKNEGIAPLTYTFGVLQSGDDVIVLDTGYDPSKPETKPKHDVNLMNNYHSPVEVLKAVGIDARDVKHVIISHAHWDHMDGIHFFPNATFYLQKDELLKWVETMALPKAYDVMKVPVLQGDLEDCLKLERENRLVLLDGDVEDLFDGVDIVNVPYGHSWAQNCVLVNTTEGKYIYVGDVANVRVNMAGADNDGVMLPAGTPAVGGIDVIIDNYLKILDCVDGDVDRVLMTHDPDRFDLCRNAGETLDGLKVGYIGE